MQSVSVSERDVGKTECVVNVEWSEAFVSCGSSVSQYVLSVTPPTSDCQTVRSWMAVVQCTTDLVLRPSTVSLWPLMSMTSLSELRLALDHSLQRALCTLSTSQVKNGVFRYITVCCMVSYNH